MGGGGAALARARSCCAGFPAARRQRLGATRRASGRARRSLRCARAHGDAEREDADPARAEAARTRRDRRATRSGLLAGAAHMSGALIWLLVALGLAVVIVRRRSIAV